MVRKNIVIVDDEMISSIQYVMELEISGITTKLFENADDCYEYAETNSNVDLYIIDIMLAGRNAPESRYTKHNTMNYLYTGCVLAREIRELGVTTPIVFFTATARNDSLNEIERQARGIGNCALLRKFDMTESFDFRNVVESVLENGIEKTSKKDWFAWIYDSVIFQPNIVGIGIDGKAVASSPKSKIKS